MPFYTVIANHDVQDKDANNHETADFGKNPDALAFYTAMHLPLNGPEVPTYPTPIQGPPDRIDVFRAAAASRFPRMANYSFDYGDAHFLCLDSNLYTDPNDPTLRRWIEADLSSTDAVWKFVVCHHPPFNVGGEHFQVQHMRVLAPIFEAHGVDIVLSGHEHNYQRPRPLRFMPSGPGLSALVAGRGRCPADLLSIATSMASPIPCQTACSTSSAVPAESTCTTRVTRTLRPAGRTPRTAMRTMSCAWSPTGIR